MCYARKPAEASPKRLVNTTFYRSAAFHVPKDGSQPAVPGKIEFIPSSGLAVDVLEMKKKAAVILFSAAFENEIGEFTGHRLR